MKNGGYRMSKIGDMWKTLLSKLGLSKQPALMEGEEILNGADKNKFNARVKNKFNAIDKFRKELFKDKYAMLKMQFGDDTLILSSQSNSS